MAKVPLQPAWRWICPDCGRENHCRIEKRVPTKEEIREQYGLDPCEEIPEGLGGDWFTVPSEVMCRNPDCVKTFEAYDGAEDECGEDPDGN